MTAKTKIIQFISERCSKGCPNFDTIDEVCSITKVKLYKPFDIPEHCPLPDYPDKRLSELEGMLFHKVKKDSNLFLFMLTEIARRINFHMGVGAGLNFNLLDSETGKDFIVTIDRNTLISIGNDMCDITFKGYDDSKYRFVYLDKGHFDIFKIVETITKDGIYEVKQFKEVKMKMK